MADRNGRSPIALAQGRFPWDQQQGESSRQYSRFILFRDMGRLRSLTKVNQLLTERDDELTYGTIRVQSHLYRWFERAQAWDMSLDEEDRERVIKARREMADRHRRIASELVGKAIEALHRLPIEEMEVVDVVRLLKLATDLEVRALGDPSQTIAITGPAAVPVVDVSQLTNEERKERLRDLATELSNRAGIATDGGDNL